MTEVLLRELSNSDIDWMLDNGRYLEVEAGDILICSGQPLEALYILLEGALTVSPPFDHDSLDPGIDGQKIAQLTSGELVGALSLVEIYPPSTTVRASVRSHVLAIPKSQLVQKVQDDLSFAAHLYRVSAILLAAQLNQVRQKATQTAVFNQLQLREAVTVFGELQDSDLDWLVAAGRIQQLAADTVLSHSSRPIDALHIILDGAVALYAATPERNRIANAFSKLKGSQPEQELVRLSRGDMVGETLFIEGSSPAITVTAVRDSQVLSIPRWRLAAKLLHDTSFAARFYRVLGVLLGNKYRATIQQLGYGSQTDSKPLSDTSELGNQFLTQVALAEARFEWILKRIQMQTGTGRHIQW